MISFAPNRPADMYTHCGIAMSCALGFPWIFVMWYGGTTCAGSKDHRWDGSEVESSFPVSVWICLDQRSPRNLWARTLNNNGNHSTWSYRITVMLGPSPHKISRSPFPRWIKRSELEAKRLEADFGLGKRWQIVGPGDSSWNLEQKFLDVYNVYN